MSFLRWRGFVCLVFLFGRGFLFALIWFGGCGQTKKKVGEKSKKQTKLGPTTHFLEEELKQLVLKAWLIAETEALGLCCKYMI